jgi:hypothetical protein
VQHGRVSPAGCAFDRDDLIDRGAAKLQQVRLERPGTGSCHTFVREVVHLDEGIVPVAVDQFALFAQKVDRRIELGTRQANTDR